MALTITYRISAGEFARAMAGIEKPIAAAATAAMKESADVIKREARRSMASGGMSKRFQDAFRVDVYPRKGESISAAAHAYHKIGYAGVFEEGARIEGHPLLWLPIAENLPSRGGRPVTIRQYRRGGGKLVSMRRRSGPPLLGAPIGPDGKVLPVFVGVPVVEIGKKFDVAGVVEAAASRFETVYARNLKV